MSELKIKQSNSKATEFNKVYLDTIHFINALVKEYDLYPEILGMLIGSDMSVSQRHRYILRAIDEEWVSKIEECIIALDTVIRRPASEIKENEVVLPIEMSRNITQRSIRHLAQNTNFISKIEGDMITPSKILNVIRDETKETYENKFLNTLIYRLYIFINRRYNLLVKNSSNEKQTSLNFSTKFSYQDAEARMNFGIEITEKAEQEETNALNLNFDKELRVRIERLNSIALEYMNSPLVKELGKSYIRPPVMRTNAILKNKDLNKCLELWDFIQSYEKQGYEMLIEEFISNPTKNRIVGLCSVMVLQYVMFKSSLHQTENNSENIQSITPSLSDKLDTSVFEDKEFRDYVVDHAFSSDTFMIEKQSDKESINDRIIVAVETALKAEALINGTDTLSLEVFGFNSLNTEVYDYTKPDVLEITVEPIQETVIKDKIPRLNKSFEAKLLQSSDKVKGYYTEIKNKILSYNRVKNRLSWNYESFNHGKNLLSRINIQGKTLNVYLALSAEELEGTKYRFNDASDKVRYQKVPLRLKITSNLAQKRCLELIDKMMLDMSIEFKSQFYSDYNLIFENDEILIDKGLIKVYNGDLLVKSSEFSEKEELKPRLNAESDNHQLSEHDSKEQAQIGEETGVKRFRYKRFEISENLLETHENIGVPEMELGRKCSLRSVRKKREYEQQKKAESLRKISEEKPNLPVIIKSFQAKVIQSSDQVKDYYKGIKNKLFSYKNVKSKISWNFETFRYRGESLAKINIQGKTLNVYLALPTSEFEGGKYKFTNAAATGRYVDVPMRLKITSSLAYRRALELIGKMMDDNQLIFVPGKTTEYHLEYMDTDTLIEEGLIKIKK